MPELAEVEVARKYLERACLNKRIANVVTREQGNGPRNGLFDHVLYEQKIPEDVVNYYNSLPSLKKNVSLTGKVKETENAKKKAKSKALSSSASEPASNVVAPSPDDFERIEDIYQSLISNKYVTKVCRKGKQLWLELSDTDPSSKTKGKETQPENQIGLLLHFGLTGYIVIEDQEIPSFRNHIKASEKTVWPPRFTKLELTLQSGTTAVAPIRLVFCDIRRLGQVALRLNPRTCAPIGSLAFDPLEPFPSLPEMVSLFQKNKIAIKPLLMNQDKIFCGIGNYLADEILYQSKIHPTTRACDINERGVETMIEKMKAILHFAINDCDGNSEMFPKDWLFHYRWDKKLGKASPKLPNGNSVIYETIGGRTTAIVPKEQLKNGYYRLHPYKESEDDDLVDKDDHEDSEKQFKPKNRGKKSKNNVQQEEIPEDEPLEKKRSKNFEKHDLSVNDPPVDPNDLKKSRKRKDLGETSSSSVEVVNEEIVQVPVLKKRRTRMNHKEEDTIIAVSESKPDMQEQVKAMEPLVQSRKGKKKTENPKISISPLVSESIGHSMTRSSRRKAAIA
jgi:formamidopyrimidine-DNA glycosylase